TETTHEKISKNFPAVKSKKRLRRLLNIKLDRSDLVL
ncbi:unnamed protein product, partial [marine sediment metagenome]